MKTIFTLTLSLCCALSAWAQGNLQFNQVQQISGNIVLRKKIIQQPTNPITVDTIYMFSDTIDISISSGKTFKVENCIASTFTPGSTYWMYGMHAPNGMSSYGPLSLVLDGVLVYQTYNNQVNSKLSAPVWLASGAHKLIIYEYLGNANSTNFNIINYKFIENQILNYSVNGIEFNIVP